ncbi:hemolysin III family protein [Maritimibacter sp. DP1N21-5]|uniref:PAQR family membrane homeostasis protein TrhA n=1 Tax=Maritimibacter sp. DP1N21-5 TaxID=2836867 RepID=UPI001C45FA79|nr:hemolysin III family protein [Maritimibacter sp. DP1N21-5]MBV7409721.1 hemolysin III family protein [Maritimibacter sp. DP1N21-5]
MTARETLERFVLDHSWPEHVADGVMHVLGVVAAVALASVLLTMAIMSLPGAHVAALVPYAVGLVATFAFSAAYNLTLHGRIRAVLRRFDHAAIYLMIAGTYTPIALIGVGGGWGIALAVANWSLATIGMLAKLVWFDRFEKLGFYLYIGMGWLALAAAGPIVAALPLAALVLLGVGGVVYTVGTIFYHKALPYARAIWHGHVLTAAVLHWVAVLLVARV